MHYKCVIDCESYNNNNFPLLLSFAIARLQVKEEKEDQK